MEGYKKQDDFEAQWASAFEGAEVQPSPHIWKNIVGALASQQVIFYRKRAFFYQMLAAASLLLAFGLGVNYFFNGDAADQNLLSTNTTEQKEVDAFIENETTEALIVQEEAISTKNEITQTPEGLASTGRDKNANRKTQGSTLATGSSQSKTLVADGSDQDGSDGSGGDSSASFGGLIALNDDETAQDDLEISENADVSETVVVFVIDDDSADRKTVAGSSPKSFIDFLESKYTTADSYVSAQALPEFFYKVPIYNYREVTVDAEVLKSSPAWAGVTMGSGSFNPNYGFSPAGEFFAASSRAFMEATIDSGVEALEEEVESTTGVAFTVGFEVGKKIAPRWIIQTGVQYGVFTTVSSTNQLYSDGNSDRSVPVSFQNQLDLYSQNAIILQNEQVDLDNRFQMLAVPVRVGYIVLDKKFNVVLNAGISGDFYLGNRLGSGNQNVDSYSFTPGDNSPYRNFHLTAITGVQLGYHLGNNYYLSVEPNYRQAITEFTKESSFYSSTPSRLGVAFGFRYIFEGK